MDRYTERILRKLPASVDDRIRQLPDSILLIGKDDDKIISPHVARHAAVLVLYIP